MAEYPIYQSLSKLKSDSDLVVVARAAEQGQQSEPRSSKSTYFNTLVGFEIETVIDQFGGPTPAERLIVSQEGGLRADGVTVKVEGSALYVTGTQYVLFLKWLEEFNDYVVVGGNQGVYIVGGDTILQPVPGVYNGENNVAGSIEGMTVEELQKAVQDG